MATFFVVHMLGVFSGFYNAPNLALYVFSCRPFSVQEEYKINAAKVVHAVHLPRNLHRKQEYALDLKIIDVYQFMANECVNDACTYVQPIFAKALPCRPACCQVPSIQVLSICAEVNL